MDVVNAGMGAFVALILVGGSLAYFFAPDEAIDVLTPEIRPLASTDQCKWQGACAEQKDEDRGRDAKPDDDDREKDDDEDDEKEEEPRKERGEKKKEGKGRGKD